MKITQVLGELFLTIGAVLLLFAGYESFWTNIESGQKQHAVADQLDAKWQEDTWVNPRGEVAPPLGDAFARLSIPAFGSDYNFAIVEGTDDASLLAGPGHYTDSQMPGQLGNFAVAGHRVGKGAPFNDLGNLRTCDEIIVETRTEKISYRVLPIDGEPATCLSPEQQAKLSTEYPMPGRHITLPGDIGVTFPVPGSEAAPSEALLTLTTCHPQFSAAERMIIHAMKVSSVRK